MARDLGEEHEVDQILEARVSRGKIQYLVKWKGYGPEDNTWEPENHLSNAIAAIKDFYRSKPGAPRPLGDLREKIQVRKIVNLTETSLPTPRTEW